MKVQNNDFGGNAVYPLVKVNDTVSKFFFYDNKNVRHHHTYVKMHCDEINTIISGNSSVVVIMKCHLDIDFPFYLENDLTNFTDFKVKGIAKCSENDTFDQSKGYKIAKAKAEIKAYRMARRMIHKLQASMYEWCNKLDFSVNDFQNYIAHNNKYLSKLSCTEEKLRPRKFKH